LELAIKYRNKKEQARVTQNIGVALEEKKDFKEAIQTLLKAIDIDSAAHSSGKIYLNLAQVYLDLGKIDSARYYANFCLQEEDKKEAKSVKTMATSYRILSAIEEHISNYKTALDYQKLYGENLAEILSENRNKAILGAENKYKFEAMQDENISLTIKHLETQRILFLTFLLIAVLTIIHYWKLLRKNKLLAKANEEILSITETAKKSDKNHLNHNLEVLKRAASLEYSVQHSNNRQGKALIKQFNIIVYGQETIDWNVLYNIINSVHNGIFDKIKKRYLNLDETDFRICCLIYSKFNSNEISVIVQLSINTVHMRTTNIRKKLRIEKYGNLIEFFDRDIDSPEN
jgi:tetratricopeptide (TPR) repeat protein/DNA-binding CsgD family transcriptional regulator